MMNKLSIPFEFHYGFDGNKLLSNEEIAKYSVSKQAGHFGDWSMSKGHYGCIQSHIDVCQKAKDLGLSSYLVFEDDVRISNDFWNRIKIIEEEIPEDIDFIFLGNIFYDESLIKNKRISKHLWNVNGMEIFGTHSFIVRSSIYDKLISLWKQFDDIVDLKIIRAAKNKKFNMCMLIPHCTYQAPGYSDINNTNRSMIASTYLYSEKPDIEDHPGIKDINEKQYKVSRRGAFSKTLLELMYFNSK